MTLEELNKVDEEYDDDEEEDEEEEEYESAEKSFDEAFLETLSVLTEHVKSLVESGIQLDERMKALETPTDFPLKPKASDKDDIGAKVTVPDTYNSNSVQASIRDDGKETSNDTKELSMQIKSAQRTNFDFTTDTPRPTSSIETINKSNDFSMVLKDARAEGYEGLSKVGLKILKGDYYTPSQEERWY